MFLSPGEKILKYRKQYQITQGELTDGKISKTYLGMVEKGKKNLSKKTGIILFKNLEKILKDKNIKLDISYEELMESSESQARKYLVKLIGGENIDECKWMIEEAILKLPLCEQKEYLLKLSSFYLRNKVPNEARRSYAKFFQRTREVKNYKSEFLQFLKLCKVFEKYKVIILIFEKYEDELKSLRWDKDIEKIYYYYVFSLWKLEKNIESSERIFRVLKNIKDKGIKQETLKLLAEINLKNKKYDEALEIYELLLKKATRADKKTDIFYNLIELYRAKKDKEEMKNIYIKLKRIQERYFEENDPGKFKITYTLGKVAEELDRKQESKSYYIEALIIGKGIEVPIEQVLEIILSLFKMFKKSDYYSLLSIEKEYFKILEKSKDFRPAVKLLEYYNKHYPEKIDQKFNIFNEYLD